MSVEIPLTSTAPTESKGEVKYLKFHLLLYSHSLLSHRFSHPCLRHPPITLLLYTPLQQVSFTAGKRHPGSQDRPQKMVNLLNILKWLSLRCKNSTKCMQKKPFLSWLLNRLLTLGCCVRMRVWNLKSDVPVFLWAALLPKPSSGNQQC